MSGSVGRLRFFGYLRLYVESLYSQTEEFRVEQEFLFKMVTNGGENSDDGENKSV